MTAQDLDLSAPPLHYRLDRVVQDLYRRGVFVLQSATPEIGMRREANRAGASSMEADILAKKHYEHVQKANDLRDRLIKLRKMLSRIPKPDLTNLHTASHYVSTNNEDFQDNIIDLHSILNNKIPQLENHIVVCLKQMPTFKGGNRDGRAGWFIDRMKQAFSARTCQSFKREHFGDLTDLLVAAWHDLGLENDGDAASGRDLREWFADRVRKRFGKTRRPLTL